MPKAKSQEAPKQQKNREGRPTKYSPDMIEKVGALTEGGATDQQIADHLGVDRASVMRWKEIHPEFCDTLNTAKKKADERVERSLYERAVGYSYDTEKVFQFQGHIVRAEIKEHVAPDTTAQIFWLKNRNPKEWRDRQEHTGAEGGPMQMQWLKAPPPDDPTNS